MMAVNLRAPFRLMRAAAPHLTRARRRRQRVERQRPAVVPGVLAYCVSKAGVDHLTRCAAIEMAPLGVRVNAVNPGVTVTNLHRRSGMDEAQYAAFLERVEGDASARPARPADEIAATDLFLASDRAGWMTGETIPIDGGRHLTCCMVMARRAGMAMPSSCLSPSARSSCLRRTPGRRARRACAPTLKPSASSVRCAASTRNGGPFWRPRQQRAEAAARRGADHQTRPPGRSMRPVLATARARSSAFIARTGRPCRRRPRGRTRRHRAAAASAAPSRLRRARRRSRRLFARAPRPPRPARRRTARPDNPTLPATAASRPPCAQPICTKRSPIFTPVMPTTSRCGSSRFEKHIALDGQRSAFSLTHVMAPAESRRPTGSDAVSAPRLTAPRADS